MLLSAIASALVNAEPRPAVPPSVSVAKFRLYTDGTRQIPAVCANARVCCGPL
jgi:hypothetical protein